MSPVAALLAALLHVATALALFWVSPLNRSQDLAADPVEVTFEEPKPAEPPPVQEAVQQPTPPPSPAAPAPAPAPPPPPPPPAAEARPPQPPPATAKSEPKPQPQPQAKSNEQLGVTPSPPEAKKADEPKPQPSQEAKLEPQKPAEPKPQPQAEAKAEPTKPAEPPPPQQEAAATLRPEAQPPAEPPLEKVVPPVAMPPAPLTMRDFINVMPPPPPPSAPPSPHQQPAPPQHTLQHSPLSTGPTPTPPGSSSGAVVSTFVNPAEAGGQTRAKDAYLWQVIRKFSQYLPDLRDKNEGGTVILRFVIARDGRLVEASIAKSSGVVALDRGLLDSLRAASPYPPLPPEIPGAQVVFVQPIAAKR
jgi:protein TonB